MSLPPPNPPSRHGDRARAVMRLRHLSPRTEEAYVQWMRRYYVADLPVGPAEPDQ